MSRGRRPATGRPGRSRRSARAVEPTISWPLATWLTPAVSMLVFGLMIVGVVAEPAGGATVWTSVAVAVISLAGGVVLLVRGGPRGRGVGLALTVGGAFSTVVGCWLLW